MGGAAWTEMEDATLILLLPKHTHAQIGEMMGRTRDGVINRCRVLGIMKSPTKSKKHREAAERKYPRLTIDGAVTIHRCI